MDGRMETGVDAPEAVVTLAVCTDRYGPGVPAIIGALADSVDLVLVVDYRAHPEPLHDLQRKVLRDYCTERFPNVRVQVLPRAQLSDCWNGAAVVAMIEAEHEDDSLQDAPWTLVVWEPDARPDRETLVAMIDAVTEDYDLAFGLGAFAVGFPAGVGAVLCEQDHDTANECLLDLTARIGQDRTVLIVDDEPVAGHSTSG